MLYSMFIKMSLIKQILLEALRAPTTIKFKKIVDIEPWSDQDYIAFFKEKVAEGLGGKFFERYDQDRVIVQNSFNDIMVPSEHQYFLLYRGALGELKRIRPTQYFKMCAEARGEGSAAEEYASISDETVAKYAELMKKGERFPIPVVDYYHQTQEGRHRAAAAAKAGAAFIPCVVIKKLEQGDLARILGFDSGWTINCGATGCSIGAPDGETFEYVDTVRDVGKIVKKYNEMKAAYTGK